MLTNGSDANVAESFELGGASMQGGNIGRQIGGVDVEGVLKVAGERVKILCDEVQAPDRNIEGQERDEVRIRSKDFVGLQVDPSTRRRIARVHINLLQGADGGLKRGGVVSSESSDIIRAKNREKKVKLAAVEEFIEDGGKGNRVDGDAGGRVKE
jgi:hypothetical protein